MISSEQFALAFDQYSGRVHRFLRSRGASEEVAEELTQQTWLLAWRGREQYRGGTLRTWLFAIAHNLYRGSFRSREIIQLSAAWDAPYSESFDRKIEAEQILARCRPKSALALREFYLEDRGPGTHRDRMRRHYARKEARAAIHTVPCAACRCAT